MSALSCSFINLLCQSFATPPPPRWLSAKQNDIQRQLLSLLLMRHSGPVQSERRQGEGGGGVGGGWKHNECENTPFFPTQCQRQKCLQANSGLDIRIRLDKDERRLSLFIKIWRETFSNSGEKIGFCSFHAVKSANLICRANRAALTDRFNRTLKDEWKCVYVGWMERACQVKFLKKKTTLNCVYILQGGNEAYKKPNVKIKSLILEHNKDVFFYNDKICLFIFLNLFSFGPSHRYPFEVGDLLSCHY